MLMTNYNMDMHIEPGKITIIHDTDVYIDVLELKRMLLSMAGVLIEDAREWLEVKDWLSKESGRSELIIQILTDDLDDYTITYWLSNIHYLLTETCSHRTIFSPEICITLY